jgi:hypothetical protein
MLARGKMNPKPSSSDTQSTFGPMTHVTLPRPFKVSCVTWDKFPNHSDPQCSFPKPMLMVFTFWIIADVKPGLSIGRVPANSSCQY